MDIQILYEERDLLVCKKPAGVPSQPDPTGQADLLTALSEKYKNVNLVHRLDTPTGGVMVFALTQKTAAGLSALVQDHARFKKEYLAVISKPPQEAEGEMRDYLFHDKRVNKSFPVEKARKGSKEAILEYRVLATLENGYTLVLVRLHTGRTHQIRVQFASRGLPLVGDGKYGSREKCPYIGLWAYRLEFPHPTKRNTVCAAAKPDILAMPWSVFANVLDELCGG
ncbi:MAG: RNA pseudouridine synthase [Clostridia bacterium]|nr:RNA pseudouridine synthase [Clostridia bacterium]